MSATTEELVIVRNATTSCKTAEEIAHNVQLPLEIVQECLDALKTMGVISKNDFTGTYCPIEEIAQGICRSCGIITSSLGGETTDRNSSV